MSSRLAVPLRACVDAPRMLLSRVGTMCLVELQKMRRDRTELVARTVQPTLHRDRMMGIGQAIMMPLFFASKLALPGGPDARLASGDQQRQPAQLPD